MRKKIFVVILFLSVTFTLYASISKEQELGYAKKLLFETARVLKSQNNLIIVDEISQYDWKWKTDPDLTTPYINSFNDTINNNKLINQKRERLQYMYEQNRSMTIASLVPNALHMVNIALNARDPLKAIIAVGGAALSSYTNYTTTKQQAELQLIQEQWELDDQQKKIFENVQKDLRTYLSNICLKYGFENEDLASPQTLQSFVEECSNYNFSEIFKIDDENSRKNLARNYYFAINTVQFKNELYMFPEYWAEIVKATYLLDNYPETLKAISNFEKCYVETMYHDDLYATIMEIKAYCILEKIRSLEEDPAILETVVDSILKMSPELDWTKQYFCVELYKELYQITKDKSLLEKIDLFTEVINKLARIYESNLKDYISGEFIKTINDGIDENIKNTKSNISNYQSENKDNKTSGITKKDNKAEIKKLKTDLKDLKAYKKEVKIIELQLLPPSNSLLLALTKEYIDLCTEVGLNNSENFNLIINKIQKLLYDDYSQEILFHIKKDKKSISAKVEIESISKMDVVKYFTYINDELFRKIVDTRIISFKVPINYFNFVSDRFDIEKDKLSFIISTSQKKYIHSEKYFYEVIRGPKKDSLEDSFIKFSILVFVPTDTGLPMEDNYNYELFFDSNSLQYFKHFNVNIQNEKKLLNLFKLRKSIMYYL